MLDSGRVKRYITDFATPGTMKMKNAVVLPHLGASTEEAEDNCAIMAVRELMDYFENGNITNSVNYPACDMGVCPAGLTRIALLHKNVPNMIAQISSILGDDNVNIANFMNKARGDYAYTLIDMDKLLRTAPLQSSVRSMAFAECVLSSLFACAAGQDLAARLLA